MERPGFVYEELLMPSEVAEMFRVDPKTVTRWARAGKLSAIQTLGGHRRYRAEEVAALLEAWSWNRPGTVDLTTRATGRASQAQPVVN